MVGKHRFAVIHGISAANWQLLWCAQSPVMAKERHLGIRLIYACIRPIGSSLLLVRQSANRRWYPP